MYLLKTKLKAFIDLSYHKREGADAVVFRNCCPYVGAAAFMRDV